MDGEPPGIHAAESACDLAGQLHARLTVVTVLPGGSGAGQADLERLVPRGSESRSIQHRMDEVRQRAVAAGVASVELLYLQGTVADAVLRFLGGSPPDLLVVGTRGLSRGSRLLLGSVSSRLVTEAPCPVLVVRTIKGRRKSAPEKGGTPPPPLPP